MCRYNQSQGIREEKDRGNGEWQHEIKRKRGDGKVESLRGKDKGGEKAKQRQKGIECTVCEGYRNHVSEWYAYMVPHH